MKQQRDAGFTLIEALVALTVLSVTAVSLLSATQGHIRRIAALNDRVVARWVAENRLVELSLGYPDLPETVWMSGVSWRVSARIAPTSDPDLARADIAVSLAGAFDNRGALARLTGFIDLGDGREM